MTSEQRLAYEFDRALNHDDHGGKTDKWPTFMALLEKHKQEAFARGRCQGLEEMDDAHVDCNRANFDKMGACISNLQRLRKEYQQHN